MFAPTTFKAPTVYLSGPIAGQSYSGAVDWRIDVSQLLAPRIATYSPMRTKQMLANEEVIDMHVHKYTHAELQAKGIVARDRNDVLMCDLMLVYLPRTERVSIGTCVEFGWADAWRKPIVTVLEMPNVHNHIFLEELSGWVVDTLSEGIAICRSVLLPGA